MLEGRHAVQSALALPQAQFEELVFSDHLLGDDLELVAKAHARGVPLVRVSKDVYKKIADVMTPQGIAVLARIPRWTAAQIFDAPRAVIATACGIQDPGNLGTLVRSAEAAGASGLIILEGGADPFNSKVVRATAAGLLALPIVKLSAAEFLAEAQRRRVRLVATVARTGTAYKKFDWTQRPLALCIGSEGEGLPAEIEAACAERVSIPMQGSAESLNAAVAASVLLFQALC
jgi:TrmH family RNA methyltransferase